MNMLWFFVLSSLQCLAVAQDGTGPMADPTMVRRINDWIQTALSHTSAERNNEFKTKIPHIIICGDQGVGKSTVLNRLVNAVIFPPRSKSEADSAGFSAKTTIATVVHVQSANEWSGTIKCTKSTCAGCAPRALSSPDEVDKGIVALQNECFSGEDFVLDHNIEINVQDPNAQEFVLVDLPGIQQDNPQGHHLTTALTQKWIREFDNAVIVAVTTGEKNFQCDIVRYLQEGKSSLAQRTILVATKPGGAEAKVKNMFVSAAALKLAEGRVIAVQNADTSDPEQGAWTLEMTEKKENEWFQGSSELASHTTNWGIGRLRKIASDLFLGSACQAINDIQFRVQKRRDEVETALKKVKKFDATLVMAEIVQSTKEEITRMVEFGPLGRIIKEHQDFAEKEGERIKALFNPEDGGGLPSIGWSALGADDPFFRDWLKFAEEKLWPGLRVHMEQGMRLAFIKAVEEKTGARPKETITFSALTRCEKVKRVTERAVLGQRFMLEDLENLEAVTEFANGPLLDRISKTVVGVAMQMCLYNPIDNVYRHLNQAPWSTKLQKIVSGADQANRKEKLEAELYELNKMMDDQPCASYRNEL